MKRVEKTDRNSGFRKRISMDRNGLKIFKEFYESSCKGNFPDDQLYVDDPDMEIVVPETIVFRQGQTTEQVMLEDWRRQFLNHYANAITDRLELLGGLRPVSCAAAKLHVFEENGIDMELVLANTE